MEITNLLLKRHHFFLLNIQGVAQLVARLLWEIKRFVNPRSKLIHTFSHCKQDHRHTGGILRAPLISAGACGDLRRGRSGTHRRLLFIPSFSKSAINKSKKTVVINQFYCVEIYIKYNFLFRYILCKIYKHILQDISNLPRG